MDQNTLPPIGGYENPFKLPSDDQIFRLREEEKLAKEEIAKQLRYIEKHIELIENNARCSSCRQRKDQQQHSINKHPLPLKKNENSKKHTHKTK